jgi:hypothetical protein
MNDLYGSDLQNVSKTFFMQELIIVYVNLIILDSVFVCNFLTTVFLSHMCLISK